MDEMNDGRRHFRLRRHVDVEWSIEAQGLKGKGKIYNISLSGIAFETDKPFKASQAVVFQLTSSELKFLPAQASLRWWRPVMSWGRGYLCGVVFVVDVIGGNDPQWEQWIKDTYDQLAETKDPVILKKFLGHGEEA